MGYDEIASGARDDGRCVFGMWPHPLARRRMDSFRQVVTIAGFIASHHRLRVPKIMRLRICAVSRHFLAPKSLSPRSVVPKDNSGS